MMKELALEGEKYLFLKPKLFILEKWEHQHLPILLFQPCKKKKEKEKRK